MNHTKEKYKDANVNTFVADEKFMESCRQSNPSYKNKDSDS